MQQFNVVMLVVVLVASACWTVRGAIVVAVIVLFVGWCMHCVVMLTLNTKVVHL